MECPIPKTARRRDTTGTLVHTETLVLVDQHRRVRGLYDGTLKYDVVQRIDDIRTLQREEET
ncbi:MAG TPA: hypothetical protein VFJ16_10930 [Longimicrobium sp.]|nr:hypothetical protein [Longimicrobium sp.]